jgi:sugar/nucleoside kinase (ribokinase family)
MDGRPSGILSVWRVSVGDEVWAMLRPELNLLPPSYQKAKTYHCGVHPSGLDLAFLRQLRDSGAEIVSVEVYTHAEEVVPRSVLQALVSAGHIFSPNEREAASLVGPGTPLELIERLSELGGEIVVLRRGPLGCIVHSYRRN